jgi:hypothetical protein
LEYGHPAGAQVKIRAEAFMEMLETRAKAPAKAASKPQLAKQH